VTFITHNHNWSFVATCLLSATSVVSAAAADYLGPEALAASHDGKTLYIALADARQLAVFDVAAGRITSTISLPAAPTGLALSPDGGRLYATCAAAKSTVAIVDTVTNKIVDSLPAGHMAHGLAVAPDGRRLYVCNRFDNDVSVIEVAGRKLVARLPVVREPFAAVATPDGKTVFVVNQLPLDRADGDDVAAVVSAIDTATNRVANIRLPNGSSSVRGLCVSPDGRYVFVVHVLSHYQLPATQLDRGWINTAAMSIIDAAARQRFATVLLDDIDQGAALPWGVAISGDGRTLFVTHAGTHELSRIDAAALLDRLNRLKPNDRAEAVNDLALMALVRQRVRLPGNGPRGVAIAGKRVYASEYFSDTLAAVDFESPLSLRERARVRADGRETPATNPSHPAPLPAGEGRQGFGSSASPAVTQVALGPKPQLTNQRRGEMLFHDATLSFQHWQACASCHPDGRADGLDWDLLNDGLGNPKNTRSLLHVFHGGPAMSLGVRENATVAVRAGIAHVLFADRPEQEAAAIDAYLKAIEPVPSPRLVDGKLSAAAEHGKQLYFSAAVGCASCHPAPYYCDKLTHAIGGPGKYDQPDDRFTTPRLTEAWRTAPYLHDGRYLTIGEMLSKGRHGLSDKGEPQLSQKDIEDLAAFVESL